MSEPLESSCWIQSPPHRLFRRRRVPSGDTLARVLIVHGYGDHSGRYQHLMEWFAKRQIASDAFDFRGHGRSSGKRGFVRCWSEHLDDLQAAIRTIEADALANKTAHRPLFVLGHSHGGLVTAAAAIKGDLRPFEIAGIILSAPYLRPAEQLNPLWRMIAATTSLLAPSLRVGNGLSQEMMTSDPAMFEASRQDRLLLRSATPRWYISTLQTQAMVIKSASQFTMPLLCLIGDADRIADSDAARQFVSQSGTVDKTFVLLPGQRHEILRETQREETFEQILSWIAQHAQATPAHRQPASHPTQSPAI